MTGLLPAWFPTEAAFLALAALGVLILAWNRGRWFVVNVLATDEPLVAAAGIFVALAAGWFTGTLGLDMIPAVGYQLLGLALLGVAALARYTDLLDLEDVV